MTTSSYHHFSAKHFMKTLTNYNVIFSESLQRLQKRIKIKKKDKCTENTKYSECFPKALHPLGLYNTRHNLCDLCSLTMEHMRDMHPLTPSFLPRIHGNSLLYGDGIWIVCGSCYTRADIHIYSRSLFLVCLV